MNLFSLDFFFSPLPFYALNKSIQKTVFIASWKTAASAGSEDKTGTHKFRRQAVQRFKTTYLQCYPT